MNYRNKCIFLVGICTVLATAAMATEKPRFIPLPYDYGTNWKCKEGKIEGKICSQFPYYDINSVDENLRSNLLAAAKSLKPNSPPDNMAYGFLGDFGSAKILIGMDYPENVASYVIFTLVNGRLVDHQLIGVDDMESHSVQRYFLISKNYQITIFTNKNGRGISPPRRLLARYQIRENGAIEKLK